MAWFYLAVAAVFEIAWAIGLKQAAGTSNPAVWGFMIACMIASVIFLGLAVRDLPIGTAYAIWTGAGTAGVFVAGLLLFGESADILRVACVGLILVGVLGLKFLSA